jgi:hypothetical protein
MKKIAFLTESGFVGKYPRNYPNSRTDVAWMIALNADHHPITSYTNVKGYDYIVVIWPKGDCTVNSEGSPINIPRRKQLLSELLKRDVIQTLKSNNGVVCYMQEGPVWYSNDYELNEQIAHHNIIEDSDIVFCHNESNKNWFKGLVNKPIHVLPTLMIEDTIKGVVSNKKDKVMLGGNCCHWYGGFQSYLMGLKFELPMYIPSMHAKRNGEDQLEGLTHLPYLQWTDWINELATCKYAIHLMPTVAAGTFSLNCAYLGIPCIGNKKMDTQMTCFSDLSVDVEDLDYVSQMIGKLKNKDLYEAYSVKAMDMYKEHFSEEVFIGKMKRIFV